MKNNKNGIWVIAALALMLLPALAACARQPGTTAESASAGSGRVTGNVLYLDRSALAPDAVIEVSLVQTSLGNPDIVLSTQTVNAEGRQVPIPFEIAYDPAQIDPTQTYLVTARILVNGEVAYYSQGGMPVITNGAPTEGIEVLLGPALTGIAGGNLTGTVIYFERVAMAPDAIITVDLQNVSSGTANVVATQTINAEGRQVPIPFELPYDPATIDPAGTYLLSARISEGGQTTFASQSGIPALTGGAPTSNVEVLVSPVNDQGAGGMIRGTVTTPRAPAELFDDAAVLRVSLRVPMLADAPATANIEVPLAGLGFPVSFELPYDPAAISGERAYVVDAMIFSGNRRLYSTLSPVPVLTQGAPASEINVSVAANPDPNGGVMRFIVTSDTPMTWPHDSSAYLNVEIREPMLADARAMAFGYIPLAGLSFPVGFELGYDQAAVDPNRNYIFDARIIDANVLTFSSDEGTPVLTQGAPSTDVTLTLNPAGGTAAPAPTVAAISGVVTTDAPTALDPAAVLYVDFREAGTTGDPIVTISRALEGQQFPVPFEVPIGDFAIDPGKAYVVGSRIMLGDQVLYASAVGVPVLTQGAPATGVVMNIPPQ